MITSPLCSFIACLHLLKCIPFCEFAVAEIAFIRGQLRWTGSFRLNMAHLCLFTEAVCKYGEIGATGLSELLAQPQTFDRWNELDNCKFGMESRIRYNKSWR